MLLALLLCGQCLTACDPPTKPDPGDPDAEIAILSPQGGERLKAGTSFLVEWKLQGKGFDDINAVNIELSPDSGKFWVSLLDRSIGVGSPDWGKYSWTVPSEIMHLGTSYNLVGNSRLYLRVMQYSTSRKNLIAVNKKPFSIVGP